MPRNTTTPGQPRAAPDATDAEQGAPANDKADGANVGQVGEQSSDDRPDSRGALHAGQALRVIEGERKAADYLGRLRAGQADADELALIVSMLYGATLRGFCATITKALRMLDAEVKAAQGSTQ